MSNVAFLNVKRFIFIADSNWSMVSSCSIIKSSQWYGWTEFGVRISFTTHGFLAGFMTSLASVPHGYIRGINTIPPSGWKDHMRQVTQCTWHRPMLNQHELPSFSLMPAGWQTTFD